MHIHVSGSYIEVTVVSCIPLFVCGYRYVYYYYADNARDVRLHCQKIVINFFFFFRLMKQIFECPRDREIGRESQRHVPRGLDLAFSKRKLLLFLNIDRWSVEYSKTGVMLGFRS